MNETSLFIPIIILLGISVVISLLVSLFKFRFIPTFVFEIIVGIALGPFINKYFEAQGFGQMVDFLYVVGFSLIMFLSGFDADLDIIKDRLKSSKNHVNIARVSVGLLIAVYAVSVIASLLFIKSYDKALLGIILVTITFSSTFAGVVAPLIHVEKLHKTIWGKTMITFSFLSELTSVILLTVYMIVNQSSYDSAWNYLIILGIFGLLYFILGIKRGRRIEEGMVFQTTKILIVALAACVVLGERGGGEYVLGAFLLGFFLRILDFDHKKLKHIEGLSYGIFIPVFFLIVGLKIDILAFINNPRLILTVLLLFICFTAVKLPLLYLIKWYQKKTVLTSIALASCTLVVAITANHLGTHLHIFSYEFGEALILASVLTAIVGPLVYQISCFGNLRYIRAKEKEFRHE
jgi:CPA2 family monovalent cation:H+ antiporter-2